MIRRTWAHLEFKTWGPCVGILSILAVIGWWGHAYHWSFSSHATEENESQLVSASVARDQAHGPEPKPGKAPAHLQLEPLPVVEFASAEAAKRCGVELATARIQAMDEFVVAHGTIAYDQTHLAQLAVRVPGVVWRVEKRVGDVVRRDDVLAIVDSAEVGQAKANLLEATVLYTLKATTLERLESVRSAIPGREIAQAVAEHELAKAQQFNALQRLVNLGFPINAADLSDTTPEELADKLQLLGLPSSLADQTESSNLIPLLAPFDGIVTQCHIVRGETVEPLSPQYVLANTSKMWIELDVRQEDAERLRLGSQLEFTCETCEQPVSGTLTWIGTEIDARTRTVHARGEVENLTVSREGEQAQSRLRVGTFGSARILVDSKPSVVAVPNSAIHWQWEAERELVFVPLDGGRKFLPRVVTPGEVRDGWVHIISGLKPGEQVVSAGSRVLASELSNELQRRVGENADFVRSFNQSRLGARTLR